MCIPIYEWDESNKYQWWRAFINSIRVYLHTYCVGVCVYVYIYMYEHTSPLYVYTYTHTCCMYSYTPKPVDQWIHTYIYTSIHTRTHVHAHIQLWVHLYVVYVRTRSTPCAGCVLRTYVYNLSLSLTHTHTHPIYIPAKKIHARTCMLPHPYVNTHN